MGDHQDRDPAPSTSGSSSDKLLRCEDMSDAIISRLLKDFTSAELFPQSGDPHIAKSSNPESDCAWDDVVVSFKHLHVRHLSLKKHRRSKKKSQRYKGSANLLNLAIAAGNLQKPIVWPARLNCDCKKPNTSLLNPSKLRVCEFNATSNLRRASGCQNKSVTLETCCLCKDKHSKQHVTSKQQALPGTLFGHASAVSSLSFKSLCHQQSSDKTVSLRWNVFKLKQEDATESKDRAVCAASTITSYSQQHPQFSGQQLFTKCPLKPLPPSEILCSSGASIQHGASATNTGSPAIYAKPSIMTSLTTAVPSASYSSPPSRPFNYTVLATSTQPTNNSVASVGRSCSQEVRDMEDTNVNELASYLEDLLHIPRKMSTMAEMMYA